MGADQTGTVPLRSIVHPGRGKNKGHHHKTWTKSLEADIAERRLAKAERRTEKRAVRAKAKADAGAFGL